MSGFEDLKIWVQALEIQKYHSEVWHIFDKV